MSAIRLAGLKVRRGAGFCLGPLDLEIQPGTATALVGPSGSGKTTLLRCIAGLERPTAGAVWLDGQEASSPRTLLPPHARGIGFVFQAGALWPHLSARAHLAFVAPGRPRSAHDELLAAVGLQAKAECKPGELSGGEGQRLALARALAHAPKLLLLDEPLHSVDVHLRDELALLVRELARARGLTLVLVTHDRDEALAMADDLVVLRNGQLVEAGPAAELLARPRTAYAAAFGGRATCLPATRDGNGRVLTPLGTFAAPAAGRGPLDLVLLPGDVESCAAGCSPHKATVVRTEHAALGALAVVVVAGRTLRVACAQPPRVGDELWLRVREPARLLPADRERPA